jgi:D-glycero-D-manno-heptose 1,7-bisphosphate phosphatase
MEDISTIFLDRDGVINRLRSGYVTSWDTFEFLPHAKDALTMLTAAGLRIVVVTNQRGIARGLMSVSDLEIIHANMLTEVHAAGAIIHAVYYCPHDKDQCACRKPCVGMFLQAQRDFPEIDFRRSAVIGDSLTDIEAGRKLGCNLILVTDTGNTEKTGKDLDMIRAAGIPLDGTAPTLYDVAVRYFLPVPARQDGLIVQ